MAVFGLGQTVEMHARSSGRVLLHEHDLPHDPDFSSEDWFKEFDINGNEMLEWEELEEMCKMLELLEYDKMAATSSRLHKAIEGEYLLALSQEKENFK